MEIGKLQENAIVKAVWGSWAACNYFDGSHTKGRVKQHSFHNTFCTIPSLLTCSDGSQGWLEWEIIFLPVQQGQPSGKQSQPCSNPAYFALKKKKKKEKPHSSKPKDAQKASKMEENM